MRINWKAATEMLIAVTLVWLFGVAATLLGFGAYALVSNQMKKSHPDDNVPEVAGIVAGVAVCLLVVVATMSMQRV